MFKQIIQFLLIAIIHGLVCPSDQYFYEDQCILKTCEPFIAKLTSNKKPSGQRFLTLNFNGTIVKKESIYQFELTFDDDENGTFYRDNKSSCIINQLYQHNLNYVDEVLDNTNISSSYSKNVRKWSFPICNLSTPYINKQKDKRVYNGYYTLRFYVGNKKTINIPIITILNLSIKLNSQQYLQILTILKTFFYIVIILSGFRQLIYL